MSLFLLRPSEIRDRGMRSDEICEVCVFCRREGTAGVGMHKGDAATGVTTITAPEAGA